MSSLNLDANAQYLLIWAMEGSSEVRMQQGDVRVEYNDLTAHQEIKVQIGVPGVIYPHTGKEVEEIFDKLESVWHQFVVLEYRSMHESEESLRGRALAQRMIDMGA